MLQSAFVYRFASIADMAQSVEHSLGKGEVTSSILVIGTIYVGDAEAQTTSRGGLYIQYHFLLYLLVNIG